MKGNVGIATEPLMKVCHQVIVNFRLQLQGYTSSPEDRLGDVEVNQSRYRP